MAGFRRAISQQSAKHVLEIGCGPWAPLVLFSAMRWGSCKCLGNAACTSSKEVWSIQRFQIGFNHEVKLYSFWVSLSIVQCYEYKVSLSIHPASRGGAAHTAGFFGQLKHIYKKTCRNIVFFRVFTMCSVENTVIYAVFGIKSVQNSGFCSVFKALASKKVQCRDLPKPLKTPLFTQFSSIFPCANAAGQLKHIYKKSFKNIVFSVFLHLFRQKRRNLYVFRLKVGPKHWFLQCVQCSGIQKPFKISLFTVFFLFLSVFPLPEADQNDPKFRFNTLLSSDTQIVEKTRKHHQYEVSVRNRFWPPPQLKLI